LTLRVATSPAATDAQIASARALVSGDAVVMTGDAERAIWTGSLAAPWRGDAAIRLSWLPSNLPAVVALASGMEAATGAAAALVGRAAGTGVMRLVGPPRALAAAVERVRATAAVGNVVLLRASRELKGLVDVWGPPQDSDRVLRSLKQMFDPAGILNAGRGPI
jgi:glycolate oxidase FAD binding subunit